MKQHIVAAALIAALSTSVYADTVRRTHKIIGFTNFDFNSSVVSPVEKSSIDHWMAKSEIPYDAQITLTGHTDATGGEQYNYQLGLDRAQNVKQYMEQYKHSDAPHIIINSKGKTELIWWTKEPVRVNRRVDLTATWVEEE